MTEGGGEAFVCGAFLIGYNRCLNSCDKCVFLIVAQMRSARRTIYVSVRIPRAEIQLVIRVGECRFTGFANLSIG